MKNVSNLNILCEENPPNDITYVLPFDNKKKKRKRKLKKKKVDDDGGTSTRKAINLETSEGMAVLQLD